MTVAVTAINITEPSPGTRLCLPSCQGGGSGGFSLDGHAGGGIHPLGWQGEAAHRLESALIAAESSEKPGAS